MLKVYHNKKKAQIKGPISLAMVVMMMVVMFVVASTSAGYTRGNDCKNEKGGKNISEGLHSVLLGLVAKAV